MLELRFEIEGEDLLWRNLGNIGKDMADWRETFAKTGSLLKKTFKDNFEVSGALLEKQWAPLKPETVAFKMRMGFPKPTMPLIGRGQMMEAFKSEQGRYHIRVYNPIEYFKYHQSSKPRRVIPRRVMIALTKKMREEIIKMFLERIDKKLMARSTR